MCIFVYIYNMNDSKDLPLKACRFIEHYAIHGNAKAAAIHAGYSPNNAYSAGHRLLQKPEVKAKINAMKRQLEEKTGWSRERMLRELEDVKLRAGTGDYPNHNAELKALDTICKMQGYFIPEKESGVSGYSVTITAPKEEG